MRPAANMWRQKRWKQSIHIWPQPPVLLMRSQCSWRQQLPLWRKLTEPVWWPGADTDLSSAVGPERSQTQACLSAPLCSGQRDLPAGRRSVSIKHWLEKHSFLQKSCSAVSWTSEEEEVIAVTQKDVENPNMCVFMIKKWKKLLLIFTSRSYRATLSSICSPALRHQTQTSPIFTLS